MIENGERLRQNIEKQAQRMVQAEKDRPTLLAKGAALGTVLAFMMSVIALSAPEMIILRKVLKPRLIATFAGVVASGILLVGYVFNVLI
jgi:uncharacterized membrane protein YraQ (UPF0718 family)